MNGLDVTVVLSRDARYALISDKATGRSIRVDGPDLDEVWAGFHDEARLAALFARAGGDA